VICTDARPSCVLMYLMFVPSARPPWLDRLFAAVRTVLPPDFYGQIELNIQGGSISNINVRQSFRDPSPAEATRE
jgi:hypothetical protein